ncbi:hypothetical protein F3Y22_tig00110812pilonHSYRG00047 [Hibiscus syriacus]|uniref:Uncharacterized protein n=1 Tax=Hibiscus syriacus TaxID=106335 RepID=A0A6A2ZN21_HIBSY|nr:hypothetical protein F3Y22_tig00110812pilonHSYRG00047 [Hibiscus syriacus]
MSLSPSATFAAAGRGYRQEYFGCDKNVDVNWPWSNSLGQELAAIFKKIGDKQTCTIDLYELYRITQLYPKIDIFAQLQNASEAFQTYIRDDLAQMEKNAAAGRTPSSVPMATPPPASLNASSPEFVPLSPVQTNSLNDSKSLSTKPEPTNFNLPPSYAEHNRGSGNAMNTARVRAPENTLADQRNERLMSGVASGTLDAIRERMKSMQLAAAGGNIDDNVTKASNITGFLPFCASFEGNGKVTLKNQVSPNVCVASRHGQFGLMVKSPQSLAVRKNMQWKLVVGCSMGAALGVFLLGLFLVAMFVKVKKARMKELARRAY